MQNSVEASLSISQAGHSQMVIALKPHDIF